MKGKHQKIERRSRIADFCKHVLLCRDTLAKRAERNNHSYDADSSTYTALTNYSLLCTISRGPLERVFHRVRGPHAAEIEAPPRDNVSPYVQFYNIIIS